MDEQMIIVVIIVVIICCCSLSIGGGIGGYLYTTALDEAAAEEKKKKAATTSATTATAAEEEAAAEEKKKKEAAAAAAAKKKKEEEATTATTATDALRAATTQVTPTCTADDSGWYPKQVKVDMKTSKICPGSEVKQTATCGADGKLKAFSECPPVLNVGQAVKCTSNDVGAGANAAVYRYVGNKVLRHYHDPEIANSWDGNWFDYIKIDCKDYTKGDAMIPQLSVKCTSNDVGAGVNSAFYKYVGNKVLRHYPNEEIADSWDPKWRDSVGIDCKKYTKGNSMKKTPNPGQAVKCASNDVGQGSGAVYRHEGNGVLRHYPSERIADSWDGDWWKNPPGIDCKDYSLGADMTWR